MYNLNVAFIQSDLKWEDKAFNREHFSEFIGEVRDGTDLILLPETFTTAFPVDPIEFAEGENGPTMLWLKDKAKMKNAVICGTILLKKDGLYRNSLIWMRPDGSFELYHKRHPFSIGGENKVITKGSERLIVELKGWKISPFVCYDIRFPVWARNRYQNESYEYDLAFYLANFPDSRMIVWNGLLVARAIENQAFVIGVNRVGEDPHGLHYSGESQVIDPRGNIISNVEAYKEGIGYATLEYENLQKFRTKFPLGPDWDSYDVKK